MALVNYNDLIVQVADWMHRSDLTTKIPDFVRMAESRMNADLDIRLLDKTVTINTVAAQATVPLPADFVRLRKLSANNGGVVCSLDYMPPELMEQRWGSYSAQPIHYHISGDSLALAPIPNAVYALTLEYYSTIAGLTPTNLTNVVFSAYPEMYLHCCLIFAAIYARDQELLAAMEAEYMNALKAVNLLNWGLMGTVGTISLNPL